MRAVWVALISALVAMGVAVGGDRDASGVSGPDVFDPVTLNASPQAADIRRVRVKGILRIRSDTDGPYLYQDMRAYSARGPRDRMVTVGWFANMNLHLERFEGALVVITGDYRKSGCRAPDAVCPHMRSELNSTSIEVVAYPDKATAERSSPDGRRRLSVLTASDPQWPEIAGLAQRLVRAVRERDAKALRELVDPGDAARFPDEALDDAMAPGGRVDWRLFAPESAFVTGGIAMPAFRAYTTKEGPYGNEQRSVAICFDKKIRSEADWPDSEFDLNSENVGDPYVCVSAFKTARGWWLNI